MPIEDVDYNASDIVREDEADDILLLATLVGIDAGSFVPRIHHTMTILALLGAAIPRNDRIFLNRVFFFPLPEASRISSYARSSCHYIEQKRLITVNRKDSCSQARTRLLCLCCLCLKHSLDGESEVRTRLYIMTKILTCPDACVHVDETENLLIDKFSYVQNKK